MDKFEYKASADEIKALIAEGEYAEAVKIADKIDWRRVRSVMMLCTISDLYKINRRYQESKDILLMAYEKHPTGRLIIYSLCELCIKMGEYDQASEYYKEFVQIAPRDTGRYVLQYRLYEALDVSVEERIAILEEFKKREPREKWVYELAYLYHRVGLTTKCVEECDEMFLWFGEGRYVIKALELKALHQPLSPEQQEKYDAFIEGRSAGKDMDDEPVMEEPEDDDISGDLPEDEQDDPSQTEYESEIEEEEKISVAPTTELPEVKTVDVGQYNTINLQMALAESMKEVLEVNADEPVSRDERVEEIPENAEEPGEDEEVLQYERGPEEAGEAAQYVQEPENSLESVDEPAASPEKGEASIAETLIAPLLEETGELPAPKEREETHQKTSAELVREGKKLFDTQKIIEEMTKEAERLQARTLREQAMAASGSKEMDKYLAQDYDGQIRLVVPETEKVEKQITGQLSIDDIMAEWEQTKKTNEEKRMEEVRQHILAQTGSLFANFDEATKNGLLEELERAFMAAIMKESGKNPQVRRAIFPNEKTVAKAPSKQEESASYERPVKKPEQKEKPLEEKISVEKEPVEVEPAESKEEPAAEAAQAESGVDTAKERELSPEEQELFGKFVHQKKSKKQLIHTLDNMSLASCTGNIIITGEEELPTLSLAKALVREMQDNDSNFSGQVAKIEGHVLNKKDVEATFAKLDNGALIIAEASKLKSNTVTAIIKVLEKDNMGLLALLVGTKAEIDDLLSRHKGLKSVFNLRVDIEPLDNEALVAYAKQYAEDLEYSIDEFGILALHTRIADRQTSDHEVTLSEVRDLVDEAIEYANKKTPKHFMDILLAKRYDEEDMIILREKDFMHY